MVGIYKITNPKGKVYIGQSVDVNRRFREYKSKYKSAQTKLINSFNKYGIENHLFEVVVECKIEELNDYERFYQDIFNCLVHGLNCILTKSTDRSGVLSVETKLKISNKLKGRVYSDSYKENMSNVMKGRVFTDEWKKRLSEKAKERGVLRETILKSAESRKGKPLSNETKAKLSEIRKGRTFSENHKKNISASKKKKVICSLSNKIWDSAIECARDNNISNTHMWNILNGHRKNNTSFKYLNAKPENL